MALGSLGGLPFGVTGGGGVIVPDGYLWIWSDEERIEVPLFPPLVDCKTSDIREVVARYRTPQGCLTVLGESRVS